MLVAKEFAELARQWGRRNRGVAAAAHEADNQAAFVQRLQAEVQLDVRVIAGLEEARLIYLGVSHGVHLGDKQAFFIDIGGGSTEVIIGDQHQYAYVGSLKLGAIRLTTHFLTEGVVLCHSRSTTPSNATCATMPCAHCARCGPIVLIWLSGVQAPFATSLMWQRAVSTNGHSNRTTC